jgi:threonine aldolase
VKRLQDAVAEILGKRRALFVPSGTMGNQLSILGHCRRGDEVVAGEGAHSVWYESGAGAAIAGVQFATAGKTGLFTADEMEAAIKPSGYHYPRTSLVCVEDTHNRAGGRVWPLAQLHAVADRAHARGLKAHLDGARLWNASLASGISPAERAKPFDSVTVCLSKGLGAPVGSVLCGDEAFIELAHRHRKMLGAGMRQVGVLAAAGLYALEHHRARLADDHAHARLFAETLVAAKNPRVIVDLSAVETNIVNVDLGVDADPVVARAKELGLMVNAIRARRLRAVTHLDVTAAQVKRAAELLLEAVSKVHA